MRGNIGKRMSVRTLALTLAGGVLFAAVAAVIGQGGTPAGGNVQAFTALFAAPDELPGWSAKEEPIADTEEMKKSVSELLNYDAGRFVVYSKGDLQISIYAAYWKAGKMSPRLVATHTPDVCGVGNGWICRVAGPVDLGIADGRKLPTKHRIFATPAGDLQYLVFCHLVAGSPRDYGRFGEPPWYAFLSELRWGGLQLRQEQLFFRISSNRPLETFRDAAPVKFFLSRLDPFLRIIKPDA